jgi:lysophospholipase L1-like esterase
MKKLWSHKWMPRVALSTTAFMVALSIAELVFRLMPPMGPEFVLAATTGTMDNALFKDDVTLRVVMSPNIRTAHYNSNSLGVRAPELGVKTGDQQRILAIGDSFTLGLQVADDETFAARLTEHLSPDVMVINAGVPGYGTEQSRGLMLRLVPKIQPDAVLLTVYSGNDLRDNANWAISPGMPTTPPTVVQAPPPQRSKWLSILAKYSRLVAYSLMFSDLKQAESDFRIGEFKDEILPFTRRDHLHPLMPPTRNALRQFAESCNELRVRCGVAIIPPAFVVHPERIERTFEAFGIDAKQREIDAPQLLIRGAVPPSVPVIDLTHSLQTHADREPYLIFDPHFSAAGHDITATALLPFVKTLLEAP